MKIYKLALSEDVYERVTKNKRTPPLDSIFGSKNNLRVVIPLENQELLGIVDKLEKAETRTKTKYKVDIKKEIAFRYMYKEDKEVLDPRPMRLGKVIMNELGISSANEWSRQVNSKQEGDYSIILSRSPIDIVRMSDHSGLSSCHSPHGTYFSHAQEEAMEGGAIAYVVDNADLRRYIENNIDGADGLQQKEIFEDRERRVRGIRPISRLRLNRYHEEDNENEEIAIPVDSIYGERVAGFYSSVRRWVYDKQSEVINFDDIDFINYVRTGGSYQDQSDETTFKDFFCNNMGVTNDLNHKGGQSRLAIYQEELREIDEKLREQFKLPPGISFGADAELDNYGGGEVGIYISCGITVSFEFSGNIMCGEDSWRLAKQIKDESNIYLDSYGHFEDIDIENEANACKLNIRVQIDNEERIENPDEYERKMLQFLEYVEENFYEQDYETIKKYLMDKSLLHAKGQYPQELINPYEYFMIKDHTPIISTPMFYKFDSDYNPEDPIRSREKSKWIKDTVVEIFKKHINDPQFDPINMVIRTPYDNAMTVPYVSVFMKDDKQYKNNPALLNTIQKEIDVVLRENLEIKTPPVSNPVQNPTEIEQPSTLSSNWYQNVKYSRNNFPF